MIIIDSISKTYGRQNKVLNTFDLDIKEGEFLSIMGPSGSGKSTLLKIISGIEKADAGSIFVDDVDILQLNKDQMANMRRDYIGIVLQDFCLIEGLSARENIVLPKIIQDGKVEDNQFTLYYDKLIDFMNIRNILEQDVASLSGGEKQRVAICRALINSPRIILADEPTGSLDAQNTIEIMKLFKHINKKYNTTIIMVTHDPIAASFSYRTVIINKGKVLSEVCYAGEQASFLASILKQESVNYGEIFRGYD